MPKVYRRKTTTKRKEIATATATTTTTTTTKKNKKNHLTISTIYIIWTVIVCIHESAAKVEV